MTDKKPLNEIWENLKDIHRMGQTGWLSEKKSDARAMKILKELSRPQ